jgi:hypothetical protein
MREGILPSVMQMVSNERAALRSKCVSLAKTCGSGSVSASERNERNRDTCFRFKLISGPVVVLPLPVAKRAWGSAPFLMGPSGLLTVCHLQSAIKLRTNWLLERSTSSSPSHAQPATNPRPTAAGRGFLFD